MLLKNKKGDIMRLRLFVLIAVCVVLDVLVARQVRQYDEQKIAVSLEESQEDVQETTISENKTETRHTDVA